MQRRVSHCSLAHMSVFSLILYVYMRDKGVNKQGLLIKCKLPQTQTQMVKIHVTKLWAKISV